jgi:hypothetical protein
MGIITQKELRLGDSTRYCHEMLADDGIPHCHGELPSVETMLQEKPPVVEARSRENANAHRALSQSHEITHLDSIAMR